MMSLPEVRWIDRPTNLRQVAPGLYVGDLRSPMSGAGERFTTIVDLAGPSGNASLDQGRQRAYRAVPRYILRYFPDGQSIPDGLLDQVLGVLRAEPRGRMLVHCAAGLSRSASVCYAMLRVQWHLNHQQALDRVRVDGSINFPNPMVLTSAWAWAERKIRRPTGWSEVIAPGGALFGADGWRGAAGPGAVALGTVAALIGAILLDGGRR